MKVAIPFFLGGGGMETLGEAPPPLNYRLPRTVKNYDIYCSFPIP